MSGTLQDEDGVYLTGMLQIMQENDTTQISEFSSIRDGYFDYQLKHDYDNLRLKFVSNGFENHFIKINHPNKNHNYRFEVRLQKMETVELEEMVVEAKRKAYVVKEDTISYRVESYADGTERKIIDVIKNLPGINVQESTGRITYNGQDIETVMLGGTNLFGNNYSLGTKQINVDIVDAIEVIENFEENPIFRDQNRSNKVALNLSLKENIVDFNVDLGLGAGLFENGNAALTNSLNTLSITQKIKNHSALIHNNVGGNSSPFSLGQDYSSIESDQYAHMISPKIIASGFGNGNSGENSNFNNQLFANNNLFYQASEKLSIRNNTIFMTDRIKFNKLSILNFDLGNQFLNVYDEYKQEVSPQIFQNNLKFQYHANAKNYFENELRWYYDKTDENTNVIRNQEDNLSTFNRTKTSWFSNIFSWTHRLNKDLLVHSSLTNSFHKSPQDFNLNNFEEVDTEKFHQYSKFKKSVHQANITLMGRKNRMEYITSTGLRLTNMPFHSELRNLSEISTSLSENNVNYDYHQFFHNTQLIFNLSSWKFTPRINLRWMQQEIDSDGFDSESANDFVLEPSLQITRNLGRFGLLSLNASYRQSPVIVDEIFQNSVMTSHRNYVSNSPSLALKESLRFSAGLFGNHLEKGVEYGLLLGIQENQASFFQSLQIDENNIFIQKHFEPQSFTQYNLNANLAKFFNNLNFRLEWRGAFNGRETYNSVNIRDFSKTDLLFVSNEINFRTIWSGNLNLATSAKHTMLKNISDAHNFESQMLTLYQKFIFKPNRIFNFSLDFDYQIPTLNQNHKTYLFSNFETNYQPKNQPYHFSFLIRNLFNENRFEQHSISEYSSSMIMTDILPRHFLISLSWTF